MGSGSKISRTSFTARRNAGASCCCLARKSHSSANAAKLVYVVLLLPRIPEWSIKRDNFAGLDRIFKDQVIRKGAFSDVDVELYKEALRKPGALTAAINYYRANVGRLFARERRRDDKGVGPVRVPTLFIFAEQDFAIIPDTVRGVKNYVDAPYREVRIADSGHWVQNEAVQEVNTALLDFLAPTGT